MVHYIALFRFGKRRKEEEIEQMIRTSLSCFRLLNEAHNFRAGRSIDKKEEFGFFISADFDNRRKLDMFRDSPQFRRFEEEVEAPFTSERRELVYETEPGKDPKYS